jgi:hypothetical protein
MRLASVGCAASFAFAVVFAPIFATALALTVVLAFARVLGKGLLFGVSHGLEGDARTVRCARGVGSRGEGSGQKPGDSRAGNHCLGWVHMIFCLGLISVRLRVCIKLGQRPISHPFRLVYASAYR